MSDPAADGCDVIEDCVARFEGLRCLDAALSALVSACLERMEAGYE